MNECSSHAGQARTEGAWIVVVDEDPVAQGLIANVLRDAGYRVQTSSFLAGTEAEPAAPSLVIFGGAPLAQQARARAVHPGVPMLALSEAAASSADAYLAAPFAAHDLLEAVRVLLVLAAAPELAQEDSLVDVGAALEVAMRLAAKELSAHAQVTCEFDTQLRVRANPEHLCLVFRHLLTTAASRILRGGPKDNGILVAGWRTAEGRTVVEISDTGDRIPAAQLAHMFEPTVGALNGDGLDLQRSQHLVRASGGDITVTSEVGGTRFRVELPTAPA